MIQRGDGVRLALEALGEFAPEVSHFFNFPDIIRRMEPERVRRLRLP